MLDSYTTGKVKRISPEAPIPVMEVLHQNSRPGGAGNVALNLKALGAEVCVLGRIGRDNAGEELKKNLTGASIISDLLLVESDYPTPVKNRLIAEGQQLLRMDLETIQPISPGYEKNIIQQLPKFLNDIDVIALSDYGKGFLTPKLIAAILAFAKEKKIATVVDPKGVDFSKYRGATVLKPNLSEAYAAAHLLSTAPLNSVAKRIFQKCQSELLLITRSEAGMSLFTRSLSRQDFSVQSREVKDVTGAGDTVLAVISLCLANKLNIETAVYLANIAAGISIERIGCTQVSLTELLQRATIAP